MRRLIATAIVATSLTLIPGAAQADGNCGPGFEEVRSDLGTICIPVVDPGGGGGGGGGGGDGGGGDGCNYFLADPQPPANDPSWGAHSPDDGQIFIRDCEDGWGGWGFTLVLIPNGGTPNPADLARSAFGEMKLTVPDVHLAPAPPAKTYVGLETWLWMPPGQWATLTKSVTAGSTTVTVVAEPVRVRWNMGAGTKVCNSAGREWKPGRMAKDATTNCSYTYKKVSDFEPGNKFKVSVVIAFQVDWTCAGTCLATEGTLGQVDGLPGAGEIQVGERQSVVVPADR